MLGLELQYPSKLMNSMYFYHLGKNISQTNVIKKNRTMEYINEKYVYPSLNEAWSHQEESGTDIFQIEGDTNLEDKHVNRTTKELVTTTLISSVNTYENIYGIKQYVSEPCPKSAAGEEGILLGNINKTACDNIDAQSKVDDLTNRREENEIPSDDSLADRNVGTIVNPVEKSTIPQICILLNIMKRQKENIQINKKMERNEKNLVEEHVEDTRFNCQVCGKNLASKAGLEDHSRMHTGEKPYKCTICEKQFRSKGSLNYHSLTHTGEKSHICKICGRGFAAKFNLKTHEKYHAGEKPFQCKKCDKGFTSITGLNYHIKKHICRKDYNCHVCGAQFANSNALNSHIRIHNVNYPFKKRKRRKNTRPRKFSQSEDVTEKKIIHADDISMDDSFLEISFPSLYRDDLEGTCLLDDGLLFREL